MTITGLDHVQIAAPPGCEAAARGFFGDLLGLPELEKAPALQEDIAQLCPHVLGHLRRMKERYRLP